MWKEEAEYAQAKGIICINETEVKERSRIGTKRLQH